MGKSVEKCKLVESGTLLKTERKRKWVQEKKSVEKVDWKKK